MVEAMGLKIVTSRLLHLPTKFHENLPISSKVIGGHKDTDRLMI
jgi:hypothetical protein